MAFPAGLTLVTVTGRIDSLPAGGASGQARFDRPVVLKGTTDNTLVPARPEYATLDSEGEFVILLPATNDPDWTPVDWAYQVEISTSAGLIRGTLQLDYQNTVVELADLIQINGSANTGSSYLALSQRSVAGGVAGLDVDGDVIDAAGNKVTGGGGGGAGTPSATVVSETTYGQGASAGNASAYSRGNHTHGTPALPTPGAIGAEVSGAASAAMAAHLAASDPHTQYPLAAANTIALGLKAPLASPTFTGTVAGITKAMVGLGSVDNTADTAKPVSTAQQTALNLKAPLASPTFTGTVSGVTAAMVGLGNVDNTADVSKPVSTAQAAADALKVDKATLTTKGDLYVATAAGTIVRLPVGSNTQVLTADSAQTAGVKWAAASGGGGGTTPTFARAYVAGGADIVPGATAAWTPVAGLTLTLAAIAGDNVAIDLACLLNQTATDFFELVVLVGGSIVRFGSTGTSSPTAAGEGDPAMYPQGGGALRSANPHMSFVVGAGDLSGGNVTFALAFKGSASAKVYASANYPLRWTARNDHQ